MTNKKKEHNYKNIYAARTKNRKALQLSSSGGIFGEISSYILENNGCVVATYYDYDLDEAKFLLCENGEQVDLCKGSKYMQSNTGNIFIECEEWIIKNPNRKIMFIGTGCQTHAFKNYIMNKKIKADILYIDIVCHGAPSPQIWKEYIKSIQKKQGRKVSQLNFKDKRKGWKKPTAVVKCGKKEINIRKYVRLFSKDYILRPSCYKCPYTVIDRDSDITIGDCWGIDVYAPDFYSKEGNSIIIIQSDKGKNTINSIRKNLEIIEVEEGNCIQRNLIRPTEKPKDREEFWKVYKSAGINGIIKKYGSRSIKQFIKSRLG